MNLYHIKIKQQSTYLVPLRRPITSLGESKFASDPSIGNPQLPILINPPLTTE